MSGGGEYGMIGQVKETLSAARRGGREDGRKRSLEDGMSEMRVV